MNAYPLRFAILLDGAFVIKKLEQRLRRFPHAGDIARLCVAIGRFPALSGHELIRNYFYHARPAAEVLINPLSKQRLDLGATPVFQQHTSLIDKLELEPDFAVRLGDTVAHAEWRLGSSAMKSLMREPRTVGADDLVPGISQKGVDLRIGLDIARLALREMVRAIVVVTGDSDLVPAFKFARREGLRVYLETLGHGVRRALKAHADMALATDISAAG